MIAQTWRSFRARFRHSETPQEAGGDRSTYERFAIPYSFKPRLSLAEAVVASLASFVRIFLGSLLFAVWGTYTVFGLKKLANWPLRVAAFVPSLLIFAVTFACLMLAISSVARRLTPGRKSRQKTLRG